VVGLTGFGKAVYLECKKDAETLAKRTKEQTQRLEDRVVQTARGKLSRAERLGKSYSPQMYFEDLADLDELYEKLMVRRGLAVAEINKMSGLMQKNVDLGHFSDSEVSVASESYRYQVHDSDREEFKQELCRLGWLRILQGLALFYLKSVGLALLLFLVRMMERRGILETVLADKKRFLLALAIWPYFLWKYPHNVICEIRVEAELRRIGGLFRRLTLSEKLWVRKVANSPEHARVAADPRLAQRGILLAFVVTAFMWLCPIFSTRTSRCLASTNEVKHSTVQVEARAGPADYVSSSDDGVTSGSSCGFPAMLEDELTLEPPRTWMVVRETPPVFRRNLGKAIEHIPLVETVWHSRKSPSGRRVASLTSNRRRETCCSLSLPFVLHQSLRGIRLT
jgi:hypothetical protein